MTCVKKMLTEGRDIVTEQLQVPGTNAVEKLQYKLMAKNLNGMLNVIIWLQNMRQFKRVR